MTAGGKETFGHEVGYFVEVFVEFAFYNWEVKVIKGAIFFPETCVTGVHISS